MKKEHEELLAIEDGFWTSGDASYYREHMAEDGVVVVPPGRILDREAAIEGVEDSGPWDEYRRTGTRVITDGHAASVIYMASASRDDGPVYEAAIATSYQLRDGSWKAVLHQQTQVRNG